MLNKKQVVEQLGVSMRTLEGLMRSRQITFTTVGRCVRFKQEWVDRYLERRCVRARGEVVR